MTSTRVAKGSPRARKTLIAFGLLLFAIMVTISGCAPRDGNGLLAQTRCAQLGDITLASGSELLALVNHIRARLGLPDFVGTWEFARDALYLGMCLDLLTSDAIAFIERYESALVDSISETPRAVKAFAVAIDPTIAPDNVPSRGFEALMENDSPPSLEIIISMATGAALLGVLFALPYTLPRVEQVNERRQVLARMKDRAFTPRDHGERGEHTFMNLGRPVGCLWEHATRAALIVAFAVGYLLWSDNASAEADVIFFCCVVYPLLALGYATVEFVSSSNRFITNHRVIQSTTFFFPREDLYAEGVSAMEVRPSILGVLFGYGTLRISMGDKVYDMHYVKDARTVKSTWEKLRAWNAAGLAG